MSAFLLEDLLAPLAFLVGDPCPVLLVVVDGLRVVGRDQFALVIAGDGLHALLGDFRLGQDRFQLGRDLFDPFDRKHLFSNLRENCRRVSGSSSNFQHCFTALE